MSLKVVFITQTNELKTRAILELEQVGIDINDFAIDELLDVVETLYSDKLGYLLPYDIEIIQSGICVSNQNLEINIISNPAHRYR